MFEKNQDILLHPKGATTMPTGIKVLVCDDDAAFCKKMADLVRKSQPVDGCSAAVTTCCDPIALTDKALGTVRYCVFGYRYGRIQRAGAGAPYPQYEP